MYIKSIIMSTLAFSSIINAGIIDAFSDLDEKDVGDVVEEVLDTFFPEPVGDIADAVIDSIDDRPVAEVFEDITDSFKDFFGSDD